MAAVQSKGMTTSKDLFEMVWEEIQNRGLNKIGGIKELLEMLLNAIMLKEREVYLQRHPEDRANGFYERRLGLWFAELDLKVPRVRIGKQFRPSILPPHCKRVDRDYEELILGMMANGYSRSQMKQSLKRLGLPFSEEALEAVAELVKIPDKGRDLPMYRIRNNFYYIPCLVPDQRSALPARCIVTQFFVKSLRIKCYTIHIVPPFF